MKDLERAIKKVKDADDSVKSIDRVLDEAKKTGGIRLSSNDRRVVFHHDSSKDEFDALVKILERKKVKLLENIQPLRDTIETMEKLLGGLDS